MTPTRSTVAEVIRSCLDEFLERYGSELTPEQRRALHDLNLWVSVRKSSTFSAGRTHPHGARSRRRNRPTLLG